MAGKRKIVRVCAEIELTFDGAMRDFMFRKKAAGLSVSTIAAYESNLKPFHRFLKERGIESVGAFTKRNFDQFRLWLQQPQWSATTVNTYLRHTRVFLYAIMAEKGMEHFSICLNRQEERVMPTYTEEEIRRLIKAPDMRKLEFGEYRNWVMVNYFLETGNRLNTVINLKVGDVDLDNRLVLLTTNKNRKQHIVPITNTVALILRKYIKDCDLQADDYLFPNQAREKMKPDSVKHAIARYNKGRGVEMTSIHAFRHTFARNFILSGGDAFRLQQHLGHSSLAMTQHYVALFGTDLKKDFEARSLIEKLTPKKVTVNPKRAS